MALNIKGLRTVGCKVADIAKAKEWYTKVLGIAPYFDEPFYVGFNVAGYELGLQPAEGSPVAVADGIVAYWGVDDVHAAWSELLAHGALPVEEPADVGGEIVVATVRDPWGNAFGIIYNPHFVLPG